MTVDPITLTVVWGAMRSICNEMGLTLQRTAFSEVVREAGDCSSALFDEEGNLVAQGVFSPGHLGPMAFAVRNMLATYPADTLRPGDAVITNDIYIGAGHLPDAFILAPLFLDDQIIGYAGVSSHLMDVGGMAPGSQAIEGVLDVYQEGLQLPMIKHVEGGRPVESVFKLIQGNVRVPDKVLGDIQAMHNAIKAGETRLLDLFRKYGREKMTACFREILDRSEAATRAAIRRIPDGTYVFEDFLDDYGRGTEPVRMHVAVTKHDDEVIVDWEGSSPQVPAGMNSARNYTFAYSFFSMKCLTDPEIPQNEGCLRPFTLRAPEGSFFNPRKPAPGGGRAVTIHRHFEVICGAMAQAVPDRVVAANTQWANVTVGGVDPRTGERFLFWDVLMGGFGARPDRDGAEALCSVFNSRNIPVEVQERLYPVVVERWAFIPDSAGAGRYRGGSGIRKDIRFMGDELRLTNVTDRNRFAPFGLFGGEAGAKGETIRNPEGDAEPLHSKGIYNLNKGDVLSFRLSGAGGYGHPFARDPAWAAADVADGFVTPEAARERYGVVLGADGEPDWAATEVLRVTSQRTGEA